MIQRFIEWYLMRKSLKYCEQLERCDYCPFGSENCECGVILIKNAFRKLSS